MTTFNPRLAAFYVVLFVTIAMLSNRVTVKTEATTATETNQIVGDALAKK